MVEASGIVHTVNNETFPNFFWALPGGGGGNFGIVTSMKLKADVVPSWIAYAELTYDFDHDFPSFFLAWQAFVTADDPPLPNHVDAFLSTHGRDIQIDFSSMRSDDKDGENARAEVQRIVEERFPPPRNLSITVFTFPQFIVNRAQYFTDEPLTYPAQIGNLTRHNVVSWKKVKSFFVERALKSDEDLNEFRSLLAGHLQWPGSGLSIEHYGGAINSVDTADTAYIHRNTSLCKVQVVRKHARA